jgi:hypothetical protein
MPELPPKPSAARFRSLPLSPAPINIPEFSQAGSPRHFGRDAEIQAMDGNCPVAQVLDLGSVKRHGFTSLCWIRSFPSSALIVIHKSFAAFPIKLGGRQHNRQHKWRRR